MRRGALFAHAQPAGMLCVIPCSTAIPRPQMQAYVYKSLRKEDTYVFLAARDDFERLPEALQAQLGKLVFVLEVDLTPERTLARQDPVVVMENLVRRGFHLQFPPSSTIDPMTSDWGTDA